MSNTECKRCGGEGNISKYAHVLNGVCFACGKRGGSVVRDARTARERDINMIYNYLAACASRPAADRADWLEAVCEPEACPPLPAVLAHADADVRARAVAAFARLGLAVA